jgi:hypothetical protein
MGDVRPRFAFRARQGLSRREFLGGLLAAGAAGCSTYWILQACTATIFLRGC